MIYRALAHDIFCVCPRSLCGVSVRSESTLYAAAYGAHVLSGAGSRCGGGRRNIKVGAPCGNANQLPHG